MVIRVSAIFLLTALAAIILMDNPEIGNNPASVAVDVFLMSLHHVWLALENLRWFCNRQAYSGFSSVSTRSFWKRISFSEHSDGSIRKTVFLYILGSAVKDWSDVKIRQSETPKIATEGNVHASTPFLDSRSSRSRKGRKRAVYSKMVDKVPSDMEIVTPSFPAHKPTAIPGENNSCRYCAGNHDGKDPKKFPRKSRTPLAPVINQSNIPEKKRIIKTLAPYSNLSGFQRIPPPDDQDAPDVQHVPPITPLCHSGTSTAGSHQHHPEFSTMKSVSIYGHDDILRLTRKSYSGLSSEETITHRVGNGKRRRSVA